MDVPTIITIVISILGLVITVVLGYAPAKLALRDLRRSQQKIKPTTETPYPDTPVVSLPMVSSKHPNNIPAQLTSLIGRDKELVEIKQLLMRSDVRLVTLLGPGGIGKTRLSLQVAEELLDYFKDGVWIVNLAPISDTGLVISTIAQTLGLQEAGGTPIVNTLKSYLRDKELLLIIDNFEQVTGAAPRINELFIIARNLKALVTSRSELQLRGEYEYSVPPLDLPEAGHLFTLEDLTQYEAVRLFIDRAQATKNDFRLTSDNAPLIAEICHRLDGLPLAIELAASHIKLLNPQAMLSSLLGSRLGLLTRGDKDLPLRQQTLYSTMEWSYNLLSEGERKLFRRLAVFQGGRTLEAIKAVCNYDGQLQLDVLEGIESLVSKSLLEQREDTNREPRFVLLETIHEYAREKLNESGEAETLGREHTLYFMQLAEEAETRLLGLSQQEWLNRLEEEHDNLRSAIRWARERVEHKDSEMIEIALRTAAAMGFFWQTRGYLSEGRQQLDRLLSAADEVGCSRESKVKALNTVGTIAWRQGNYAPARFALEGALAIGTELGDKQSVAYSLSNLGIVAEQQGDRIAARALCEQSLALQRELGDQGGIAFSLNALGVVTFLEGTYVAARTLYEQSLALRQEIGDRRGIAVTLGNLGNLQYRLGAYADARSLYEKSLAISKEVGYKHGIAHCLAGLGGTLAQTRQPQSGARLLGSAEALLQTTGTTFQEADSIPYNEGIASALSQLSREEFEEAWHKGRVMSMEEAIEYALEKRGLRGRGQRAGG